MVFKANRCPGRRAEGVRAARAPAPPPWPHTLACTVKDPVPVPPPDVTQERRTLAVFQSWGAPEHPPPALTVFSGLDRPCTSFPPKGTLGASGVPGVGRWGEKLPTRHTPTGGSV